MGEAIRLVHVDADEEYLAQSVATFAEVDDRFAVRRVGTAEAAVSVLEADRVDCIVSEYELPETDGIELLEMVRARVPDLPFILLTNTEREAVAGEALAAGVSDYVQKQPGANQFTVLAHRIENLVSRRRAEIDRQAIAQQQSMLVDLAARAISTDDLSTVFAEAVERIADGLAVEYVSVFENDPLHDRLRLRAGTGGHAEPAEPWGVDSQAAYTIQTGAPVIIEDFDTEARFEPPPELVHRDVKSGISVIIGKQDDPWGVLAVHTKEARQFGSGAVNTVQMAADLLSETIETDRQSRRRDHELERYRAIVRHARDVMLLVDDDHILAANHGTEDLFDRSPSDLRNCSIEEILPEAGKAILRYAVRGDGTDRGELVLEDANGTNRNVEYVITADVVPGEHLVVLRDVTDQKDRERQLRLCQRAVDAAGHSIYWTDRNGVIEYVNPAFEHVTGYGASEAIGMTPRILKSGEHDRAFYAELWDTILAGEVWHNELVNRTKDGDRYIVNQTIAPIRDDEGEIRWFVAVNDDLTDRKRHADIFERLHGAAPALYQAETVSQACSIAVETITSVLGHSLTGVWLVNDDRTALEPVTHHNQLEINLEPPIFEPGESLSWDSYRTGDSRVFNDVSTFEDIHNEATVIRAEIVVPIADHGVINVGATQPAQFDQQDCRFVEIVATHLAGAIDRIAATDELRTKTNYLDAILTHTRRPMFMKDREGRYLLVNHAYGHLFELTEEEVLGATDFELHPEDRAARFWEHDRTVLDRGDPIEVEEEIDDGTDTRVFLSSKVPIHLTDTGGPDAVFGTATDITDRKRAEAKQQLLVTVSQLVGSTETFSEALELAVESICRHTAWEYGEVWLPTGHDAERLTLAAGNAECDPLESFLESSVDVTFGVGEGLPGRVYETGTPEWITDVSQADSDTFRRTQQAESVGLRAGLGVPLVAGEDILGVLTFFFRRAREADDRLVADVLDVIMALDGLLERRRDQQSIEEQRDALEMVNEILRHDIRNDLSVIDGYSELLEDAVEPKHRDHLETIRKKAAEAISLTRTARDLSSVILEADAELHPVELGDCLARQLEAVRVAHPEATITVPGPVPDVAVPADALLDSVFRNLFQNAVKHNDHEQPHVLVTTRRGEHVVTVTVSDNGPGIPDDRKHAVFGRGEKGGMSAGSGIGLYLVDTLVDRYGGEVWIEDNEPRGTTVGIRLPIDQ